MRVDYKEFKELVARIQVVADDAMSADLLKNLILQDMGNGVCYAIGYNQSGTYVERFEYEGLGLGVGRYQLPIKRLMGYLSKFENPYEERGCVELEYKEVERQIWIHVETRRDETEEYRVTSVKLPLVQMFTEVSDVIDKILSVYDSWEERTEGVEGSELMRIHQLAARTLLQEQGVYGLETWRDGVLMLYNPLYNIVCQNTLGELFDNKTVGVRATKMLLKLLKADRVYEVFEDQNTLYLRDEAGVMLGMVYQHNLAELFKERGEEVYSGKVLGGYMRSLLDRYMDDYVYISFGDDITVKGKEVTASSVGAERVGGTEDITIEVSREGLQGILVDEGSMLLRVEKLQYGYLIRAEGDKVAGHVLIRQ